MEKKILQDVVREREGGREGGREGEGREGMGVGKRQGNMCLTVHYLPQETSPLCSTVLLHNPHRVVSIFEWFRVH